MDNFNVAIEVASLGIRFVARGVMKRVSCTVKAALNVWDNDLPVTAIKSWGIIFVRGDMCLQI
jgi:hypothetical protein